MYNMITHTVLYALTHTCSLCTLYFFHVLVCAPVQLFRADLISAMKLPDSTPMESGSFLTIREPWRTEWEIGVQVRCYKKKKKHG